MSEFNSDFPLAENIRGGLWVHNKNIDMMAEELDISKQNITVAISRKFKRGGNITPQDQKMIVYLIENCAGFKQWTVDNEIEINS